MAQRRKSKHGGKRPGAGRPLPEGGEAAVNGSLRLYPATWTLLDALCERTGLTRREVVTEALTRLERSQRWQG